eukprot:6192422-Ditylum_brightwellii.AAC.1
MGRQYSIQGDAVYKSSVHHWQRCTPSDQRTYGFVPPCGGKAASTINIVLNQEADRSREVQWWVDANFTINQIMISHTRDMLSLRKGEIYGSSTSQKLNTKSSTKDELIGVDNVMPQILWICFFLETQGSNVADNILYQ